jgi:hypothetical protein
VVASSTADAAKLDAFRAALALGVDEGQEVVLPAGDQASGYRARVVRAGRSATAGKVAWLVPRHHRAKDAGALALMTWFPALSVALTFALLFACSSRSQTSRARAKRANPTVSGLRSDEQEAARLR